MDAFFNWFPTRNNMPDLRPAPPEFYERVQWLIAAFPDDLGHLRGARFKLEVRDTAPIIARAVAWGEVDAADTPAEEREFDFSIWFALDKWQVSDERGRNALTTHELLHCNWSDKGEPILVPHDVEIFNAELKAYGVWWADSLGFQDALRRMPPLVGAGKGNNEMKQRFQRPMHGSFGSGGVGSFGSGGVGSFGSGGVGSFGSGGVKSVYTDPSLKPGDEVYTIDLGNGEVIELCPMCFHAAAQSIFADLLSMMGGMPEQGSFGSGGV